MSIFKFVSNIPILKFNRNLSKRFLTNLAINHHEDHDFDQYFETEIKYNKQYKFFYEKNVPIAATMSLCPICKGTGWITKNNFNQKKNEEKIPYQFRFDLCTACNGKGSI